MPINDIEQHPFLQMGESIQASRMIIGTFPIYSLTNPRTTYKNQLRKQRGDMSFFYGSQANYFWSWYKQHLDTEVKIQKPNLIIHSLQTKNISISDVIKECSRIEESFEDSNLRNIKWNLKLDSLIEEKISKVICTSKSASGAMRWLRDKILLPASFHIDQGDSIQLHLSILNEIPQSNRQLLPVAQVLVKGTKRVRVLALPSPGSPQRRLVDFGYDKNAHITSNYLEQYLSLTFKWFLQ